MKWLTAALLVLAAVLGGLLVSRSAFPTPVGGTVLDTPVTLPPLKLVDERGQARVLSDSAGRMRLVFFGFVRCPDVCPATLAALKNIYADLKPGQRERMQVQLISVDPQYDRPAVLRDYLGRFDPAFTGLTGEAGTIDRAAEAMFVANVAPQLEGNHAGHAGSTTDIRPGGASVAARIHGDEVRVVDPRGRFVRVYGNQEVIAGELERDLPGLIRLYGR
ncbi:SCO family protein [Deinococcus hopiensis]|uniref:Protein SCO1/2 n=1 Tax=Deinococcus hopiensis KR-140 TaxID=695939 RepID=A0A1W1VAE3_9DEIO|nr:SCO family protein [Deinococcus hopiensis]SMB90389.1 protein SCO1/2 [Deinococcus hopiensis KR-140]